MVHNNRILSTYCTVGIMSQLSIFAQLHNLRTLQRTPFDRDFYSTFQFRGLRTRRPDSKRHTGQMLSLIEFSPVPQGQQVRTLTTVWATLSVRFFKNQQGKSIFLFEESYTQRCPHGKYIILIFVVNYHNRENLPKTGSICVANHTTVIDIGSGRKMTFQNS